jgi:hypothetical protein
MGVIGKALRRTLNRTQEPKRAPKCSNELGSGPPDRPQLPLVLARWSRYIRSAARMPAESVPASRRVGAQWHPRVRMIQA